MTNWGSAEERDFQRLVRQAEQQSKDYYRRAGGTALQKVVPLPPLLPPPPPTPVTPVTPVTQGIPPSCGVPKPKAKQQYRVKRKNPLPMMDIDSETAVLVALLWLMWQEQADIKAILAIAYILLV